MSEDFERDLAVIQEMDVVPRVLEVVCEMTGMGFAAVARVTGERWVALAVRDKIKFGLAPGGELAVETTICSEIRDAGAPVVIDNVAEDDIYCSHPTPRLYGFQSYISVPIMLGNGRFFGTLCAIDPAPRELDTPQTIGMFKLFAELIAIHLQAAQQVASGRADLEASRASLASSEANLLDERNVARLREEFIAVLGHDLRNPLAAVDAGVTLLLKREDDPGKRDLLRRMRGSVLRMTGLIDNLLDFARGRLGGGIELHRNAGEPLAPVLTSVVDELRSSHPDRSIEARIDLERPVDCDHRRIGQLLSNLLGNALTHGAPGGPITVGATTEGDAFVLAVANAGDPIPDAAMANLFKPFHRAGLRASQQGLGLGLFIASEIARAHAGTLTVDSTSSETRFTFRMPLQADH